MLEVRYILLHAGRSAVAEWRCATAAEQSINEGACHRSRTNHEGYWEPELHKLRGDIAAAEGTCTADAERAYRTAIECATTRGLVALKLRAEGQLASLKRYIFLAARFFDAVAQFNSQHTYVFKRVQVRTTVA